LKNKIQFNNLNILRGLAALWIVLYHLKDEIYLNKYFLFSHGFLAVDFFFILSGFVMSSSYLNLSSLKKIIIFLKKRFYKIYPLHFLNLMFFLISLVFFEVISNEKIIFFHDNFKFDSFIYQLLLINGLGIENQLNWNVPSWAISTQFFVYIIFIFMTKIKSKKINNLFFIFLFLFFLKIFYLKKTLNYHYDFGIIRNLFEFYIGNLIFTYRNFLIKKIKILVILFLILLLIYNIMKSELIFIPLFAIIIILGIATKDLKMKYLNYIGKISYSIFVNQWFIILFLNFLKKDILNLNLFFYLFINITLIIIVSVVTYEKIEKKIYVNSKKFK
jgi:peptidoglycan/LPS O-acetylase OafA/YrhL